MRYNHIDIDDIIQELALKALESPDIRLSEDWVYDTLREWLNDENRAIQTVSLDEMIENGFDFYENDLFQQECDEQLQCDNLAIWGDMNFLLIFS